MCNQTEMYLEIDRYDDRAARGEVPPRGVNQRKISSARTKTRIKKEILHMAHGRGMKPVALLEWFEKNFYPCVSEGEVKDCLSELIESKKIVLTSERYIRVARK